MKNSYRFFANRDCKYYPCHEGMEEMNCLFCYCPFFLGEKCPGRPTYWENKGKIIKDCSACTFPHKAENYDRVIEFIRAESEKREYGNEIKERAVRIEKEP